MAKKQGQPLPPLPHDPPPAEIDASTNAAVQAKPRSGWKTREFPVERGLAEFGAPI
jgi:hypothetical protein